VQQSKEAGTFNERKQLRDQQSNFNISEKGKAMSRI
jgi:hypothetical protein